MKEKITVLRWFDILIITIIMFGDGIYNSTLQYMALSNQTSTLKENLTFSSMQNYRALALQLLLLFLAFMYLLFRNFDFSIWTKRIVLEPWLLIKIIGIFILAALAMDIYALISYNMSASVTPSLARLFPNLDLSLILYSLLNGFYEEIFFLGVCLAVKSEYTKLALLYSLIIRISFHTYQGLGTALALGILVGFIFYLLYRKLKPQNLLPFFLAHALADVIGLSVISYFWN
ncbi:CPBP family intramembrane glutamic endopeptidase [Streptococcus dentapri]|uniref:CPBP family intramembrane glutamic endopeptidase n=1 Tax=Streptococcus dentapri TaxID=573564 RepID=A0ABV8CZF3_9STRE